MQAHGVVIQGRFGRACSDEVLIMQSMREARRRANMSPAVFGAAIGVGPGAVEAYETGFALPVVTTWHRAMALGGLDARPVLVAWLSPATGAATDRLLARMYAGVRRLSGFTVAVLCVPILRDLTAPISPWW